MPVLFFGRGICGSCRNAFYKGEEEIVPIDSWGDAPATANTFAYQVYDNEPLSYFISSKPGASVTVDFGKVVTIDNFMYMPRNDDNFVRIGDYYELFYWGEGCWNSLGKKIAENLFYHMTGYHRELCSICMTVPVEKKN